MQALDRTPLLLPTRRAPAVNQAHTSVHHGDTGLGVHTGHSGRKLLAEHGRNRLGLITGQIIRPGTFSSMRQLILRTKEDAAHWHAYTGPFQ